MQTIQSELIEQVWSRVNDCTEEAAQAMAQRAQESQPYIMVYLLAMDENMMSGDQQGLLMQLGAIILEVMYEANPNLDQVTDEQIETAEESNIQFLQDMEEGSEMDYMNRMQNLVTSYNQMPLLGVVIEALMSGHEDNPELAPESLGIALIYLKTVIDCLDQ